MADMQSGAVVGGNVTFFNAEAVGPSKVVKGAPYSAQTVTEHTQTLADGNVISQTNTGMVYRDSEGRTRREQSLGPIGPVPEGPNPTQLIFINDPVAAVSYVLDPSKKTAQKLPLAPGGVATSMGGQVSDGPSSAGAVVIASGAEQHVSIGIRTAGHSSQPPQQESLGSKAIEGVQAEGTRTTLTIPAGQIGNQRPIETVSERWYSPQLQVTVLNTTNDPMLGQTSYRLTNVSLAEPAPSLFEIPADYTLSEGPSIRNLMLYAPKPAK